MLKIGEFSKLSRVSVRMLRHYDEIGLLKPAEIDRFTDYRYYREDRYAATIRMTIPRDEDGGMIWGKLAEETCRMNLVENDPCLCAVTCLDGEYKEENVEMMAWKTVKGSYPDTEHVKFHTLPEVTVASCTYLGSYTRITDVYTAVIAWMEANGYEPAEPMFNIYHVSPHETQNPDEFVTEVCNPAPLFG